MGIIKYAVIILLISVAVRYYFKKSGSDPETFGSCDPKFKAVEEAFNENYRAGYERGSAFSLYYKGQKVCDLYGGFQDDDSGYPWQEDTMSIFFSATKGVSAICLLVLEDRGFIDYSQRVSKYWPEFAQNGKGQITVQQLLSHQAGLAAIDEDISYMMIAEDVETLGNILAKQAPNWTPGSKHGYHALTFALYVEQLVMRVDPQHRRLNQFFHEEIAKPFDIDFYIGAPIEEHHRIATFMPFNPISALLGAFIQDWENFQALWGIFFNPDKVQKRALDNPVSPPNCPSFHRCHNWPTLRACPMGSVYGYGTARAMAKLYGILANGGSLGGKTLMSKKSLPRLTETVVSGRDRVILLNTTWGNGFMFLDGFEDSHLFGHLGFGSQVGLGNLEHNVGIGYVTIVPSAILDDKDIRFVRLKKAIIDSIKKL